MNALVQARYRTSRSVLGVVLFMALAACGRGGDGNLWKLEFPATQGGKPGVAMTGTDVTGYWEGDVAMGGIRLRIEPASMTLAMRCDGAGKKLAQGAAPIVLSKDPPARIVLQEDLAGGDEDCGFRFLKGNQFGYALNGRGTLEIAFADVSVSRLVKLADLPAAR